LVSADKANVLATSRVWRRVVDDVAQEFPEVTLKHLYADNVAMQLISAPTSFSTILTANFFGDILSDVASVLTGSIGLPAAAMFNEAGKALYEPGHGSAPDIAGRDQANPIAAIRCVALMMRYTFSAPHLSQAIEEAVGRVLAAGLRTPDICQHGDRLVGTDEMGEAIAHQLKLGLC
jgi:3-isopropylmalate dehydrogenase